MWLTCILTNLERFSLWFSLHENSVFFGSKNLPSSGSTNGFYWHITVECFAVRTESLLIIQADYGLGVYCKVSTECIIFIRVLKVSRTTVQIPRCLPHVPHMTMQWQCVNLTKPLTLDATFQVKYNKVHFRIVDNPGYHAQFVVMFTCRVMFRTRKIFLKLFI